MKEYKSDNHFRQRYGPWALVAGASKGLGAEYATQLAEEGLNLVLIARGETELQSLASRLTEQYQIAVRPIRLDLAVENAAAAIAEQTADLDIGLLVYNAGYSAIGRFLDTPLDDHLKEIETNVRTPLMLAHAIGQRMLARPHGGMILMSSLSAGQGSAFISNYAATKAYNQILAEGIWEELRSRGIDVLVCRAGAVSTPNYQASLQTGQNQAPAGAMPPRAVVRETLAALGRRPSIIPGRGNRMAAFVMQRLLPRTVAIRLMGRVMRGMYS